MMMASRKWVLVAGAAALLSSQAVWAAPVSSAPTVDPLVSLSLFGSEQSRAAVCGSGDACAVPTDMSAVASPAIAGTAASAAVQYPGDRTVGLDWPGLFVLFLVPVAITLAILLEDSDNEEPVSPF